MRIKNIQGEESRLFAYLRFVVFMLFMLFVLFVCVKSFRKKKEV